MAQRLLSSGRCSCWFVPVPGSCRSFSKGLMLDPTSETLKAKLADAQSAESASEMAMMTDSLEQVSDKGEKNQVDVETPKLREAELTTSSSVKDNVIQRIEMAAENQNVPEPAHLQGAWVKPLNYVSPGSSKSASRVDGEDDSSKPSQGNKKENNIRFPWDARMNPASRNLYRATEPEYMEDGTPIVTIPRHILLQGLENQKEYILGQFYMCSPPPGSLIFAVFNKIWGRNCTITIRKLGESSYLFHIPDEATRNWVLQRGLWHVDDCLMFVASWTPEASLAIPVIKTIPVWVTLKKIPNICYSIPAISHIASGLGAPMATHKPRLDPVLMGEAKILVEVELSKAFPSHIAASDENGFISMVDVEYSWLPPMCSRCSQLGKKMFAERCWTNNLIEPTWA